MFASKPQNMIMTQVQKAIASGSKIQELNFNHPVKYLAAADASAVTMVSTNGNKLKLQINGTDVADYKYANPHFTSVPLYYHTSNGDSNPGTKLFTYPFCLDTGKLQPTGTLNFSRLDSARIVNDTFLQMDRETLMMIATIVAIAGVIFLFKEMNKTKAEVENFRNFSNNLMQNLIAVPEDEDDGAAPQPEEVEGKIEE
jgi:hypothetical protein